MSENYKSVNLSDEDLLRYSKGKIYNHKDICLKGSTPAPVAGGLYDRRIFGSERYCNCGRTFSADHICPVCAVKIEKESELKKNFGHIELNYPYISPYQLPKFVNLFTKIFGEELKKLDGFSIKRIKNINSLIASISKLVFIPEQVEEPTKFTSDGQYFDVSIQYADDESEFNLMGLHGLKLTINSLDMDSDLKELDTMIHKILLVSPAITRNCSITNVSGKPLLHVPQATIDYQAIIYANNTIKSVINGLTSNYDKISRTAGLALLVAAYMSKSQLTASSKQSFIRSGASTTAFESGRATIVSDFNLKVTEISIPFDLLYHAISYEVIESLKSLSANPESEYRNKTKMAVDVFNSIIEHSSVVAVRNPSLHKYNETAFRPIPSDKDVIGLPPLVCQSYNADFDGDQMAFFVCTDEIMSDELMSSMSAEAHWYYTKSKDPVYTPNREILQGLGEATKLGIFDDQKKLTEYTEEQSDSDFDTGKLSPTEYVNINGETCTYGRYKISKIIGHNIDDVIGTENFICASNIVEIMVLLGNDKSGSERLRDLQNFSIEVLKRVGVTTLTLRDLYVNSNEYASGFNEILASNMSDKDKDFELTRELGKVLEKMMADLQVPNIKKTIEESNRYKPEQLTSLIGPTIIPTDEGFEVEMSSYLDSKGTKAYIEDCINNRTIWEYKQKLTPVGGYNARQLNVIAKNLQFVPRDNPNTEIPGVYVPYVTEKDKKRTKGRVIKGPAPIDGYVELVSCVFNGENKVYSNEIDSSIYRNKSGELHEFNIGIDMASSFSESSTQASLGLKHGGSEWVFTDEAFRVPFDCKIAGIDNDFIVVESNGKQFKYRLPINYELTNKTELNFKDILFTLKEKVHITKKLADISNFLGTVTVLDVLKNAKYSDCYSFGEGPIHYEGDKVIIGDSVHTYMPDAIYYFAEGEMVKKYERICSGVANMKYTARKLNDKNLEFIIFRKQLLRLAPSLNPDICEVLFKSLTKFDYSVKNALNKGTNLISSLYMGSTVGGKKVLTQFVNNGTELFDENDLLYKLIFQQGLVGGLNVQ